MNKGSKSILPVAQYLRMSTDKQEYSILNQRDAIAAYADGHSMQVVSTYADEGRSGLSLHGREGLQHLIRDVHNEDRPFRAVLVYDVSRWGRFQDVDEGAYYEYVCKRAGVPVTYCAELFQGGTASPMDAVVKAIKRAMAAEFSRELGEKVLASQLRAARLGFHTAGRSQFGLQRLLVDGQGRTKFLLPDGARKEIKTDRVVLTKGRMEEVKVVQSIFRWYVEDHLGTGQIANRLNQLNISTKMGARWDSTRVGHMLRSELYAGMAYFNRRTSRLGAPRRSNCREHWIAVPIREKLVSRNQFDQAAKLLCSRRPPRYSDEQMLAKLRDLLAKRGRLTPALIQRAKNMPKVSSYHLRFGSLHEAYKRIGYTPACAWASSRAECNFRARVLRSQLMMFSREALELAGLHCTKVPSTVSKIDVNGLPVAIDCRRTARKCAPPSQWTASHGRVTLIGLATPSGSDFVCFHVYDRTDGVRHWKFLRSKEAIACLIACVSSALERDEAGTPGVCRAPP